MLDIYKIITVTHKDVHLEQIADFILPYTNQEELSTSLHQLKNNLNLGELLYIATCNRVVYFFTYEEELDVDFIQKFINEINSDLSDDLIQEVVSVYEGEEAIQHIYEVSASIDSLIVGEREINRQIRTSFEKCDEWKLTGDNIRLMMKHLVQSTKEVHSKTRIGEKPVSVVSLAISKLLETNLPHDARIVLIGAGQTNTLVTKFLAKEQFTDITIFNRTLGNAKKLAEMVNGKAYTLEDLSTYKKGFDCLIVCTGATEAIIDKPCYEKILNGEQEKKVLLDLSIPHNISKEVVEQSKCEYIEIGDLKELASLNLSYRKQEIGLAKLLLKDQIAIFKKAFQQRQLEKALHKVPVEIKAIKERALNIVFKKDMDRLDEEQRALFEKMMTYMEKKCISIPMKAVKELVE